MKTERLVATVCEDRNRPETVSLNVLLTCECVLHARTLHSRLRRLA